MNFKDKEDAKAFIVLWALVIVGVCLLITILRQFL